MVSIDDLNNLIETDKQEFCKELRHIIVNRKYVIPIEQFDIWKAKLPDQHYWEFIDQCIMHQIEEDKIADEEKSKAESEIIAEEEAEARYQEERDHGEEHE
jgi:hypothetical protein